MDILSFLQDVDISELFSTLVQTIMVLMGGLVVRYLLPWMKQHSLDTIVDKAVKAAEMLYPEQGSGAQKKIYVNSVCRAHSMGKRATPKQSDLLNMFIEASVQEINQQNNDDFGEL